MSSDCHLLDAAYPLHAACLACAWYLLARCSTSITKQLSSKCQAYDVQLQLLDIWVTIACIHLSDALSCLVSDFQAFGKQVPSAISNRLHAINELHQALR